jgi:hypothetical protein
MWLLPDMSSAKVWAWGCVSEGMRVAVRIEDLANLDHDVLPDRRLVDLRSRRVQLRWR